VYLYRRGLAGTSRLQYPPNARIIRLMCSGAVDVSYVLKPLLDGADGVLIGGCHPGDCHYQEGNYKARRRIAILEESLKAMGIDPHRVWLRWISASEAVNLPKRLRNLQTRLKKWGQTRRKYCGWCDYKT